MFLSTIIASTVLASAQQATGLTCPVTGQPVVKDMKLTELNGAVFSYCCPGCDTQFAANPEMYLSRAAKAGKTVGSFLFDPVTHKRLDPKAAKGGFSDYGGIRYYFETEAARTGFDTDPKAFTAIPKQEALYCPVSKEKVASYTKASGYGDYAGVRYYFCCAGCDVPFAKDPAKYAPAAAAYVKVPKAVNVTKEGMR